MSFTMTKSVEEIVNTTVSGRSAKSAAVPVVESLPHLEQTELSARELQSLRDDKLAAIRQAVDNGDYDSDAVFDKALAQMLRRLEESGDEQ